MAISSNVAVHAQLYRRLIVISFKVTPVAGTKYQTWHVHRACKHFWGDLLMPSTT